MFVYHFTMCYNHLFMLLSHAIIVQSRYHIPNLHLITCTYYPIVLLFLFGWVHFPFGFVKKTFEGCFSFHVFNSYTFRSFTFFHSYNFHSFTFLHSYTFHSLTFFNSYTLYSQNFDLYIFFIRNLFIFILFFRILFIHILLHFINTISNNSGIVPRLPKNFSKVKTQINITNINSACQQNCIDETEAGIQSNPLKQVLLENRHSP